MSHPERAPEALLIDLDGTLADSHAALRACFDAFLAGRGIVSRSEDFDALDGVRLGDIPARLQERFAIDEPLDELRGEYQQRVVDAYANVTPAAGAAELVRGAASKGIRLVLVTSAPRALADAFLRAAGLADAFAAVVSGEDGPGKPDPALFERALELARVPAERALAIEDAPSGVRAARSAGVDVLGVARDPRRDAALRGAGAADVVPDLEAAARALSLASA
jgi:HAD superfamily hydrolase (TIGR01509 family)